MIRRTLALAVAAALAACGNPPAPPPDPAKAEAEAFVERARVAVRASLRDPDSAKFRKASIATAELADGKSVRVACGYVNARNGFGGYTGDGPWLYFAFADGSAGACVDKVDRCPYTHASGPAAPAACLGNLGP